MEQSDVVEEHHGNSIGHDYGDNDDGLSENKERIVLPSLVSRVMKDDAVMKGDEDSREESDSDVADFETPRSHQDREYHSAVNDDTDSVSSNEEVVEGSRYDMGINNTAERKEHEDGNSNLNTVAATATATATTTATADTDANPHL